MKGLIFLIFLVLSVSSFASQNSEAFLVTIKNMSIQVISPAKKIDTVSVVIKNDTSEKLIGELRSETRVLKRFSLAPLSNKTLLVNMKNEKQLYYVSVAPPFQAVALKFNERPYEIPEKN